MIFEVDENGVPVCISNIVYANEIMGEKLKFEKKDLRDMYLSASHKYVEVPEEDLSTRPVLQSYLCSVYGAQNPEEYSQVNFCVQEVELEEEEKSA